MAIEAFKGQQTISELSKQFELTPKQICGWKKEFLSKTASVFTKEFPDLSKDRQIRELHARIGEMDVMIDFLKKSYDKVR